MSFIVSGERCDSVDALRERASRAASGLAALRVGKGDLIALFMRNDPAFFEVSMAAGMLGAYTTPFNWHSTRDEVAYLINDAGPRVIVAHADFFDHIRPLVPEDVPLLVVATPSEVAAAYGVSPEKCPVPQGEIDWTTYLQNFPPYAEPVPEAPVTIVYTSGTTGRPKGVRRFPPTPAEAKLMRGFMSRLFGFSEHLDDPSKIVVLVCAPMYHSAPNTNGTLALNIGANIVLQPKFDAEDFLRLVDRYRVTHIYMAPIMFNRLLALPDEVKAKYDLSSLQHIVHMGAPCPAPVKRAMIDWWGPIVHEGYGATEIRLTTICSAQEWLERPGTVGRPIAETEVLIVDPEGNEMPRGEAGEITARTPGMPDFTYHGNDEKRQAAEINGMIATGDIGFLDEDGYLFLCDRARDLVISGGVNIYPAEIEAALSDMPGVGDSAAFGIPDKEFGESVCLFVQPAPGASLTSDNIRDYLKAKIAGYKVPRRIELHASLPREDSGKIMKRKLRDPFWAEADRRI